VKSALSIGGDGRIYVAVGPGGRRILPSPSLYPPAQSRKAACGNGFFFSGGFCVEDAGQASARFPLTLQVPRVVIGPCPVGRGLFAARDYQPGQTILNLAGPQVGREDPIHQTEAGANLLQTGPRSYILLGPPGVFANHSCDPNAGIKANRKLVAIKPIARDEEIRFDYSTTMAEDYWTLECRCGSPLCRGTVTDFRLLPEDVKRRYLELGVVQGFIARAERRREVLG
jgi:hypothetical protein